MCRWGARQLRRWRVSEKGGRTWRDQHGEEDGAARQDATRLFLSLRGMPLTRQWIWHLVKTSNGRREPAQAAAQLRDAHGGAWGGSAQCADAAGACGYFDDAGVYTSGAGAVEGSASDASSESEAKTRMGVDGAKAVRGKLTPISTAGRKDLACRLRRRRERGVAGADEIARGSWMNAAVRRKSAGICGAG